MPSRTRRSVLAAVGACIVTAGCVADPDGTDGENADTSERPTETTRATTRSTTDVTTAADPNTTGDWIEQASNEPDPDLPVYLNNEFDESRTVRIRVVRTETGETVFEATRDAAAGTEVEVYNLERADPEGVEAFRVCGTLVDSEGATETTVSEESDARDCATLRTNECYGTGHVTVREDETLRIIYSIC